MHSSSVSTRPATCVDGGGGVEGCGAGAGGWCGGAGVCCAGGGVCAVATPLNSMKTKRAISASDATTRGLDIGTREYHAALWALQRLPATQWTVCGCAVDSFFLDER